MNLIKSTVFSALLGLSATGAFAIQVTSVTAQTGRVEGQSVEISAAVNWEQVGPELFNPVTGPFYRVSAQAGGKTILLSYDSATSRYRGQFQGLLFDNYSTTVTATKTTKFLGFPPSINNVSATRSTTFGVGPQAGCFNFNQGNNLQGWTVRGLFDGDQSPIVFPITPPVTWSDPLGFRSIATNNDGALVLGLDNIATPPSALFSSGFSRFDFVSPDLTANTNWQGMRGISFRMAANPVTILDIQPIISTRRPDGTPALFRPVNGNSPVFLNFVSGELVYRVLSADINVPADHTVTGVQLRVFGTATSQLPDTLTLDGVCPRR
jgi:hypothetical protein